MAKIKKLLCFGIKKRIILKFSGENPCLHLAAK
jgi:hypothetical protein